MKKGGRTDEPATGPRGGEGPKGGPPPKKEDRSGEQTDAGRGEDPLKAAYGILREALGALSGGDDKSGSVRDSDLKRKMLRLESSFDEGELGFGKFSRFLRQAHDHEVIDLQKRDDGTYQVSARGTGPAHEAKPVEKPTEEVKKDGGDEKGPRSEAGKKVGKEEEDRKQAQMEIGGEVSEAIRGVGVRRGTGRARKGKDGPPPFLEGQIVGGSGASSAKKESEDSQAQVVGSPEPKKTDSGRKPRSRRGKGKPKSEEAASSATPVVDPSLDLGTLGLPTGQQAVIRYLTNSYKGVGRKTAEAVVTEFGPELFEVLFRDPGRLASVLPAARAEQLLEGWKVDLARRTGSSAPLDPSGEEAKSHAGPAPEVEDSKAGKKAPSRRRTRGAGSGRGKARKKKSEGDSA